MSASAGAAIGNINVTAGTGCAWTAASHASWIAVTSGASGNGNGAVGYSVTANTGTGSRIGTLAIAGLTFTIIQNGTSSVSVAFAGAGAVASALSVYSRAYPIAALNDNQRTGATAGKGGTGKMRHSAPILTGCRSTSAARKP
ncbi:MAG: BACON domain-containing protein [Gallionellaceae bacterium]